MNKPVVVIDAPSNLGLRPPLPGVVPGVYKLAGALRDQKLLPRLAAQDGGVVVPPRYSSHWDGKTVRNASAIATYTRRLADRVQRYHELAMFPLLLGGDCSILLGPMLALRRTGRYGLVFIDGHLDFRHPGNAEAVGSAAGEDLALVSGRGTPTLTDLEGLRPFVHDSDIVALGFRPDDEYLAEAQHTTMMLVDSAQIRQRGSIEVANHAIDTLRARQVAGYWIHLDADTLDSTLMPAVDTPTPGGLSFLELSSLLSPLLHTDLAVGLEITVFDPDLDPDGSLAQQLVEMLVAAFDS